MKAINNFIVEHLKYSTFSINEKLKISSRSDINIYTCHPKDKYELRKILEERLEKDKNADLNNIDVSEITDMGYKGFKNDNGLFEDLDPHNIDISEWNVSKVTDMSSMFSRCKNLDCDLSNWNVSKVTNMSGMFYYCKKFTGKGLENWNVHNVKNMNTIFENCIPFNCDLSKWDVGKVENMNGMFRWCENFEGKGLENWNVLNVVNMCGMFNGCKNFDCDLSNWDVSNVKNISYMFQSCYKFIGKGLDKWKINFNIVHGFDTFKDCTHLKYKIKKHS